MERGNPSPVVIEVNLLFQRAAILIIGSAFWICSSACVNAAQSKPADCTTPLWTAPVVLAGDEAGKSRNATDATENGFVGVAFLDDDRLIVHEVDRTGELSSRTNLDPSSAFRLHASVFVASSGKALFAKDWDTRAHDTSVGVTSGGVLVRTGRLVRFYSRDFLELQEMTLPQPNLHDAWVMSVSATGKTVMFNHYDQKESRFEMRDGSTFKQLKAWGEGPLRLPYSISEVGIGTADPHP